MSEQFHFSDGRQLGTQDLSWSYASVVSAHLVREQALKFTTPTTTPPSTGVCAIPNPLKQDCGFAGITQKACEENGCCWKALTPGTGIPWCYKKTAKPRCSVAVEARKTCGRQGINMNQCKRKGCCWERLHSYGDKVPACYNAAA